jgi:hypothetical protein
LPQNLLKKVPAAFSADDDEATEFESRIKIYQDLLRDSEAKLASLQKECDQRKIVG